MSDKENCPGCDSTTSSVLSAFRRGEPCPYCHLPSDVAAKVLEVRAARGDEALKEIAVAAEVRAARAEARTAELESALAGIGDALAKAIQGTRIFVGEQCMHGDGAIFLTRDRWCHSATGTASCDNGRTSAKPTNGR